MNFPVISPTGALASGAYTTYMIQYDGELASYIQQQLGGYYTEDTINDWSALWDRTMYDIQQQVTDLSNCISSVQAKITMIQNAI